MASSIGMGNRRRRSPRRAARALVTTALAAASLGLAAMPAGAEADRWPGPSYDPTRAGHPLRIVAYVVHPLGVALDYAILRPAWWVGQREPFRTIFGVQR